MDKYEYKVRSEEISNLIDRENYTEAVAIADTIDWRRVKSATMLLKIAALYRINRRNEDSREMLLLAYERYPTNRSAVYSLCELSIELDDVVAAIEYYKQFAKLAPKDIGVFTLRYRILEAQEASLEERIAILEELKKRDYQEEWAYELAYMYHRVGLATKCVEECDEIILWFGHGSYVLKAMELKSLHAPLSAEQQKAYNVLTGQEEEYTEEYADTNYTGECYQNEGYTSGEYIDEGYIAGNYADEGYQDGIYQNEEYPSEPYADGNYNSDYTGEFYVEQAYDENGNPIPPASYENKRYSENENYEDSYEQNYGQAYDENYEGGNYGQAYDENYESGNYEQAYDENYEGGNYEQAYDENYEGGDYGQSYEGNYENYDESYGYEDAEYVQQSNIVQMPLAGDMSQYNTINLQKVVAEGMKEFYADDDDVFAEDREKYNPTAGPDGGMGDTRIFSKATLNEAMADKAITGGNVIEAQKPDTPDILEQEPPGPRIQTGRIAQLVTNVSEAEPEPDTGAISKVIIPGNNARLIKTDSDMDELRDITEKSVDEEHSRMEHNDENVYHEQSLMGMEADEETGQDAAPMKLDDVLVEWERMKQDNAKKHQEEIKKQILTQTGKILANFDDSVKNGILGELEREDGVPQTDARPDDSVPSAEDTGGASPARTDKAPDDEFDVAYVSEEKGVINAMAQETAVASSVTESTVELNLADDGSPKTVDYEEGEAKPQEYYEESKTEPQEYYEESGADSESLEYYEETGFDEGLAENVHQNHEKYEQRPLDPEDEESIVEMAKEDALKTQEIKMNTADLSSLSERIVETTNKEATGAKREEVREFTPEEQALFENFAVTKKIKKQIIYALDNITLAAYTGNIIITGDAGLDTVRMAKNLIKEHQAADANFSGKLAKITGEKFNQRNIKDVFAKLDNGGIIIEKANGMTEEKLYEMALNLNQENIGIVVIMEDTKKEITKLLEKQAMIADYFNIRIDLMEMDNNALVAYAKNYALALEYSIDELGTLALYTRIANMQSGNHVVTKDEVRDIIDEAIWKSKKSKVKNFVDVLFSRRYDNEDMIVLKERDFM